MAPHRLIAKTSCRNEGGDLRWENGWDGKDADGDSGRKLLRPSLFGSHKSEDLLLSHASISKVSNSVVSATISGKQSSDGFRSSASDA